MFKLLAYLLLATTAAVTDPREAPHPTGPLHRINGNQYASVIPASTATLHTQATRFAPRSSTKLEATDIPAEAYAATARLDTRTAELHLNQLILIRLSHAVGCYPNNMTSADSEFLKESLLYLEPVSEKDFAARIAKHFSDDALNAFRHEVALHFLALLKA